MKPLQDQVAVVAGATRGAGRGIAAMLELFGVTKENWKDAVKQDPHFIMSETPMYVGRAIAALAADPNKMEKTGQSLSSWGLSDEYDFVDEDGNRPHWGNYAAELGL